jgi:hypothetical protein
MEQGLCSGGIAVDWVLKKNSQGVVIQPMFHLKVNPGPA